MVASIIPFMFGLRQLAVYFAGFSVQIFCCCYRLGFCFWCGFWYVRAVLLLWFLPRVWSCFLHTMNKFADSKNNN